MRNRLPLIAIALVLAGLVTFLIMQNLEGYKRQAEQKYQKISQGFNLVPVVVVTQDVAKRGTMLTAEMVKVEQVPERGLQPYAAQDPLEVIGKEPLGPLKQGQQILTSALAAPGAGGSTLSSRIPQGKRAVSIPIDLLTGVSGFIRPNDTVDIVWTFAFKAGGENQPVTLVLFQNIQVLAVGAQMRTADTPEGQQAMQEAKTATLALLPQEAELLLFAGQQGRIQLALRARADAGAGTPPEQLSPATMDALLKQALPGAATAEPAWPAKTIEIIRGKTRELMQVTPQGNVAPPPAPAPASPATP